MRNRFCLQSAFTLIEMLITLSIIAVLAAITIPMIGAIGRMSQGQAGEAAISTAVSAARILNHRLKPNALYATLPDGSDGFEGQFEGTAVLFTPDKSVRFLVHNISAADRAMPTLLSHYLAYPPGLSNYPLGYKDIDDLNDLTLPASSNIVGVLPDRSGDRYVLPPFAIRFDRNGNLALNQEFIYYDKDFDGAYDIDDGRQSYARVTNSNPFADLEQFASAPYTDAWKRELPFEKIEVVMAIVLFDRKAFETSGATSLRHWLDDGSTAAHRKTLFFSPQTGLVVKE